MPINIKSRNARLVVFGYNVATDRIVWTRDPEKQLFVGDRLDLTGTIITAYYKDGTMSDITDLCSYDPEEGTLLRDGGEVDLTASYTDRAGSIFDCNTSIRVGAIEFIRFTRLFQDQNYVGDTPKTSDLRVEAVWTDLSGETSADGKTTTSVVLKTEDITDRCSYTVNGQRVGPLTEGGLNTVEAHFTHEILGEYSCSAEFAVGAIEYLALYVPDAYWTQKEDTRPNTSAMRALAVWTDLSGNDRKHSTVLKTQDITDAAAITATDAVKGYIPHIDYNVITANRYALDGTYTSVYVTHPLTFNVRWSGYETDTAIETNPIDCIWWKKKPSKVKYKDGDKISYSGAEIWASYLETENDTFDVTGRCSFDPAANSVAADTAGKGQITATFKTHAGDVYESRLNYEVRANPNYNPNVDPSDPSYDPYPWTTDFSGGELPENLLADLSNLDDWNQNRPDHFETTYVNHSNICYFHGHSPNCGTYWDVTVDNPYNAPLVFTWLDAIQNCTPFAIPITINGTTYNVAVPGTLKAYIEASPTVTIHAVPDRVVDSEGTFSVSGITLRRADSESWKGRED